MLSNRLLSRAFTFPLMITRLHSTMTSATTPQTFSLDRNIFNETLYSHIRSFWFAGIPAGSKHGNAKSLKRWWGAGGRTEEESRKFDGECRDHYGIVLESIGPEKVALSGFTTYRDEVRNVREVAKGFLEEVEGREDGFERLLSLVLLLDQIPRNIYRDPEGLKLVYGHYDRLAWALVKGSKGLKSNPLEDESLRGNVLVRNWLVMPLMHAEDLESQEEAMSALEKCLVEAREDGDRETVEEAERALIPAGKHLDIVKRFGRFPHRNECLGRKNTKEEGEWLKTGETFGVKQVKDSDLKAEL